MSIYLSIANDVASGKVCSAFVNTSDPSNVQVAPAEDYQAQSEYVSLSRAMAELSELEGDITAFMNNGYAGKVWVTCMRGLALKVNKAAKGEEIYQSFMDSAEGPWGEYCKRITALVNAARKAGIVLQAVPAQQLTRSEVNVEVERLAKAVDDKTVEIDGVQYTDGQTVTFEAVPGSAFQHVAGKLVIDDAFVHGERKLRVRPARNERDHAHITVQRFAEDTEDGLPNTAYGDAISWLRYATQPAMANLRDGRAPRAKKAEAVA